MVRTQISLTEEQADALRRLAAARSTSLAALIRGAVDEVLAREAGGAPQSRFFRSVGRYGAGTPGDAAERHDDYLDEAFTE